MTKAVVFDLDGTLLNTLEDLADSCNKALAALGYPMRTLDEIRRFVGNGIPRLVKLALPEGTSDDRVGEAVALMRKIYALSCAVKTRPYDGVPEMLAALAARGIRTAVVSNKPDAQVKELCRVYFSRFVDERACIGDAEGRARKPAPDGVCEALAALDGVSRRDAVYVGDSEVDIATARNAGMRCVIVSWGFRARDVLVSAGAPVIIDKPSSLLSLV